MTTRFTDADRPPTERRTVHTVRDETGAARLRIIRYEGRGYFDVEMPPPLPGVPDVAFTVEDGEPDNDEVHDRLVGLFLGGRPLFVSSVSTEEV